MIVLSIPVIIVPSDFLKYKAPSAVFIANSPKFRLLSVGIAFAVLERLSLMSCCLANVARIHRQIVPTECRVVIWQCMCKSTRTVLAGIVITVV